MRILRGLGCTLIAAAVWLGSLHWFFERSPAAVAGPLAARQLALWSGQGDLEPSLGQLRRGNPEWDLMARMFTVLAFANLALDEPAAQPRYVAAIDRIIERTQRDVARGGPQVFLLPYGRERPFLDPAARSLFVDGELALMLAAREAIAFTGAARRPAGQTGVGAISGEQASPIAPGPEGHAAAAAQVQLVIDQIERAPELLAESYPDEVWVFCHAVALAAVALHDASLGAPDRHRALFRRWIAHAKQRIVDADTGLLVARTTRAGRVLEGPEGSTLWVTATMLRLVDDDFAHAQYARARAALRGSFAGFGWAREWPASWPGKDDIDSGPTIPLVGANAGSSGLALIAARAFDDEPFTAQLITSLELAGFPVDGGAHLAAGNQLADAALLYALVSGALWHRVLGRVS
jgi:hypothetical protein